MSEAAATWRFRMLREHASRKGAPPDADRGQTRPARRSTGQTVMRRYNPASPPLRYRDVLRYTIRAAAAGEQLGALSHAARCVRWGTNFALNADAGVIST